MGARRMHPPRKKELDTKSRSTRCSANTPGEKALARKGCWCPFRAEGIWRHGAARPARQLRLVQMELAKALLGAPVDETRKGPDDASMMTILEHGTPASEGEVSLGRLLKRRKSASAFFDDRESRRRCDATGIADNRRWKDGQRELQS